jgi:hypothetical protein
MRARSSTGNSFHSGRHERAIDGEAGTGQGRRAERQFVQARTRLADTFAIAQQHRHVRHQVMAERYRLSHLQVGKARHHGLGMALRLRQQNVAKPFDFREQAVELLAGVKSQIGGDLIVTRPRSVKPLAGLPDERRQPLLDVHMNVFQLDAPLERARSDLATNFPKPTFDIDKIGLGQHPGTGQHGRMGQRAVDVVHRKLHVFGKTLMEIDKTVFGGHREQRRPGFRHGVGRHHSLRQADAYGRKADIAPSRYVERSLGAKK